MECIPCWVTHATVINDTCILRFPKFITDHVSSVSCATWSDHHMRFYHSRSPKDSDRSPHELTPWLTNTDGMFTHENIHFQDALMTQSSADYVIMSSSDFICIHDVQLLDWLMLHSENGAREPDWPEIFRGHFLERVIRHSTRKRALDYVITSVMVAGWITTFGDRFFVCLQAIGWMFEWNVS